MTRWRLNVHRIDKGPIARGTIRTTLVLGIRLLVQAGTLLLVTRLLGPHDYGAFAGVAALAVMMGTLSTFGMNLVLLGEMSRDSSRRERVMSYAVPCTLAFGMLLLAIFMTICLTGLREAAVPLHVLLAIGATETLLQPLFGLPASEQLALGRVARSQLLTTLPLALRLTAAAGIFLLGPTQPLTVYAYAYFTVSVLALAFTTLVMPEPWSAPGQWRMPSMAELREAAGYAALNVTTASPSELDKTLATKLLPLADSGVYAAGARVIGAATLPIIAMILSALPRLFKDGHSDPGRTIPLVRSIFIAALAYSIAVAAALWFIAPELTWLFGKEYQGIEHTLHFLTLAVPGMALRMTSGSVLMALGRPWMRAGFEVAGLVILVAAATILARTFGATGMPLALACSEWSMAIIGIAFTAFAVRSRLIDSSKHSG
ncbi:oligosaccharide flippase family protein [Oleiagrimonas sp.]|uniref:lipopolysaccharide biosynthesis protein n=1 Tax=Oleiagrimonas sp. TaxID=2010330 RepID=UPI0026207ED4|nr:oligosaccharide flippase family protein [Oleiagrimonas sp.]MDA3913390.1 oligosaccharide flippase family protein [Oleiagrimonas sp.]